MSSHLAYPRSARLDVAARVVHVTRTYLFGHPAGITRAGHVS